LATGTGAHGTEPGPLADRVVRRPIRGENPATIVIVATTLFGLAWFNSDRVQPARSLDPDEMPGSGIVTHTELLHVWLPATTKDWAEPGSEAPQDLVELGRLVDQLTLDGRRYAITLRTYQVSGRHSDITFIRCLGADATYRTELLEILAFVCGLRECDPDTELSTASIHFIPTEVLTREPSAILAEMRRFGAHRD
jgi:hypothetical protein